MSEAPHSEVRADKLTVESLIDEAMADRTGPPLKPFGYARRTVAGCAVCVRVQVVASRGIGRAKPHYRVLFRLDGFPQTRGVIEAVLDSAKAEGR